MNLNQKDNWALNVSILQSMYLGSDCKRDNLFITYAQLKRFLLKMG